MIFPHEILFAALEDILEPAALIIFVIISILGKLLGGKKNNPQRGRRPRQPQIPQPGNQPPPGAGQQAAGGQMGMEEVLRKEVDEFLRRAQGKPPQPKPQAKRPELSETIPRRADPVRQQSAPRRLNPVERRLAQQGQAQQRLTKPKQRPETKPAVKVRGMGVSEHVAEHISGSTQEISQHAEQLGDDLELTDERVEDRLHKKFDHKVGRLQHIEVDKVEASVDLSAEIAEMLSNPAGMRQLIIANEILRRPFG